MLRGLRTPPTVEDRTQRKWGTRRRRGTRRWRRGMRTLWSCTTRGGVDT
jgi:hypothetical protein